MERSDSVFTAHDRQWRQFQYIYPVISRRAKGLSIGVNLNPNAVCNYDCVYCQVDRTAKRTNVKVDLAILERELRHAVQNYKSIFDEPRFRQIAPEYRRLNDMAFSGDGEPTASPAFPAAVQIAALARRDFQVNEAKIVIITNACFLKRPKVSEALAWLDQHNSEIWAKLDAGSEDYHQRVNRSNNSLREVLDNILAAARVRPLVIQSLFPRLADQPPSPDEIEAYIARLRELIAGGGQISLVQLYTVARQPAEAYVSPLSLAELEQIAERVRGLGLRTECYG